ncbi:M48 family metalloprotease [Gramella sp. KN1008]|uniref:M48 family metalloprotease n=1 Tax=Gramella sp. KN1008 TaxID=2529298 RepID=UPI00103D7089|nr:M48 family metalloprotease [Gramella sp. KN1008]TBW28248.1 hypothetical protein EZJ28_05745 [Gramella sp. KN1008]
MFLKQIKRSLFLLCLIITSNASSQGEEVITYLNNSDAIYEKYLQQYEVYNGPESIWLKQVGEEVKTAVDRMFVANGSKELLPLFDWEFNVVKMNEGDKDFMVFPGGKVLISKELLGVLDTANELAWMIAHGLGHVFYDSTELSLSKFHLDNKYSFSDDEEMNVDEFSLSLMAIAGFNPDVMEEMWNDKELEKKTDFFDYHPRYEGRLGKIREFSAEAKSNARKYGVTRF